jgi:uncharacterized protein (TIGR00290 family)
MGTGFDLQPSELALSWSGGKDSSLALWVLREEHRVSPRVLITTITETYQRISMHGVRRELLHQQASSVGVPLAEVLIPAPCSNALYEQRMAEAFASDALRGIKAVAAGDLFLQDVREYREQRLGDAGMSALFPLWKRDTTGLARQFVAAGFRATLVCVDPSQLDPSFAGRSFDESLLADLPSGVDPCGENGEFHTFVHDGPIFSEPVACRPGDVVERDGFFFCELLDSSV